MPTTQAEGSQTETVSTQPLPVYPGWRNAQELTEDQIADEFTKSEHMERVIRLPIGLTICIADLDPELKKSAYAIGRDGTLYHASHTETSSTSRSMKRDGNKELSTFMSINNYGKDEQHRITISYENDGLRISAESVNDEPMMLQVSQHDEANNEYVIDEYDANGIQVKRIRETNQYYALYTYTNGRLATVYIASKASEYPLRYTFYKDGNIASIEKRVSNIYKQEVYEPMELDETSRAAEALLMKESGEMDAKRIHVSSIIQQMLQMEDLSSI